MKEIKRIFAPILAFVLIVISVAVFPSRARAANAVVENVTQHVTYTSWADAVASVHNGDRLVALDASNEHITTSSGQIFTIDFGSYTCSCPIIVAENSDVTLAGGRFIAAADDLSVYSNYVYGTVRITGGTYEAKVWDAQSLQFWCFNFDNYGSIYISGGTFYGATGAVNYAKNGIYGNTYISGGNFVSMKYNDSYTADLSIINGNTNETAQHTFITGGKYTASDAKLISFVESNLTNNARTMAVDDDIIQVFPADETPMFRLYNPNSGEHFYTSDLNEKAFLVNVGWNYESIAWSAGSSGSPVYRVYNPNSGDHHYTINEAEKDFLVSVGWNYEGIGWYSEGDTPLYRLYNPNCTGAGSHHYTTNAAEKDMLISLGWNYEGIGWYGLN